MSDDDGLVDPTVRRTYVADVLPEQLDPAPMPLLRRWWREAAADERVEEVDAMVVATVDEHGHPDARTVLAKDLTPAGITFYTHTGSAKGRQLAGTPYAALVLLWHPMRRQVRVRGLVTPVDRVEAAGYFATRPRGSQLASSASRQSQPVSGRAELEEAVRREEQRWPDTGSPTDVPLPQGWGGYRVRPDAVELWVGQPSRLHDRAVFTRCGDGGLDDAASWTVTRLQP